MKEEDIPQIGCHIQTHGAGEEGQNPREQVGTSFNPHIFQPAVETLIPFFESFLKVVLEKLNVFNAHILVNEDGVVGHDGAECTECTT